MAGKRACESDATAAARQESNRVSMADKRACESNTTAAARRESNRVSMASRRASQSTIDKSKMGLNLYVFVVTK